MANYLDRMNKKQISVLDASVVVNKIIEAEDVNYGYDAMNGVYVNMIDEGIIDPTKVSSTACIDFWIIDS